MTPTAAGAGLSATDDETPVPTFFTIAEHIEKTVSGVAWMLVYP
jgi:hypothetical protein